MGQGNGDRAMRILLFFLILTGSVLQDTTEEQFYNPLLDSGPDPYALFHLDGYYYFTHTLGSRLDLWRTRDITDLRNAERKTIFIPEPGRAYSENLWAPEVLYLRGRWFFYFAADNGDHVNHRMYVLENESEDPFKGKFKMKGKVSTDDDNWAIDGDVFEYEGALYMIWSGWQTTPWEDFEVQRIYIARMSDPTTFSSKRVEISHPEYEWEMEFDNPDEWNNDPGRKVLVNEGPQVLKHSDKVFIVYSASGCWTPEYKLGLLEAADGSDLLDPDSWKKHDQPVFSQSPEDRVYGTGHNSFFKSPDGTEDWILYHANDKPDQGCERYRKPRAQRIGWTNDGSPEFGKALATSVPIEKPSGTRLNVTQNKGPGLFPPADLTDDLKSHNHAVYIKEGWIRDPYIYLAPDGYYYLTGTTPNPGDPREEAEPYNTGLDMPQLTGSDKPSIVGSSLRVWRSTDLVTWENLGVPFTLENGYWAEIFPGKFRTVSREEWRLWAPEIYLHRGRWILVHTSPSPVQGGANLAVTLRNRLEGPFSHPMEESMKQKHDPSLFLDDDGVFYLLWGNTWIAPLNPGLNGFAAEPVRIDPSGNRPGPEGEPISRIGHEGATIRKIGEKYVHFGTAWSTDRARKGTYNLYYCTADKVTGPYGPRRFAGRFLGHGTPFRDKDGRWWCTAFYNANVPPITPEMSMEPFVANNAYTINEQGVTLVPLDVRILDNGDVRIRAIDPAYASPGPEEVQDFGGM
jgi:arylsulfatase